MTRDSVERPWTRSHALMDISSTQKSPLAEAHRALNNYLVRFEEVGWKTAAKELNALRDKRHKLRIWMALLERLDWLHRNNPDSPGFSQLRDVTYSIETWKLSPTEADLVKILHE